MSYGYPQSTSPPPHRPIPQYAQPQGYAQQPQAAAYGQQYGHPQGYAPQQPQHGGYASGPQGAGAAGYGGQPPAGQGYGQPGGAPFGFFNDPSAQLGAKLGMDALSYGQNYINQNMDKYVNVGSMRYYFQVSNSYVLRKVLLVLFPWTHKPWSRQLQRGDGQSEAYAYPRDDLNAPDMYIPAMAFTTWLTLVAVLSGLEGKFHPQLIGVLASKSTAIVIVELVFLKIFTYLLASQSKMLDFVAFAGYKFIGVSLTILSASLGSFWVKWLVFAYTSTATAFFMLRSLRFIMLEAGTSGTATVNTTQRQHRIQFLFFYTFVCQYILMWVLL